MTLHQPVGPPRVIRCGVSKLLIWMGLALVVIGILAGIGGVIGAAVTGDMSLLSGLILTAVFGTAGLLMHLCGKRCRVEVSAGHVAWTPLVGSSTTVPWPAVHHVEVPEHLRDGTTARLVLHDGQRLPVTAIRMSSSTSGSSAWADSGYREAGRQLIAAHKTWLATGGVADQHWQPRSSPP